MMVTFTLTPDNFKSIPENVVNLIVAEGVTEIPPGLCFRGERQGIESLETVVFSKSVSIIREYAFYYCTNLKSLIFPKDSQLREIERAVFQDCKSLQSIDIPDSVTTIGRLTFYECTNLESVLFTDQSCLQEIEGAFIGCHSLLSIIIPKSVTEIGRSAFEACSKLKSVIFAEHSSIQIIYSGAFYKCTSLQFINIPTTVTTINIGAFVGCPVLQVIDIPPQAVVHPDAFKHSHLLSRILEEHGTDCMKGRFDALPIHQTCYNFNNNTNHANDDDSIVNYFLSLQDNDPALLQVDIMGMTPLHILCANPAVTKDMIKQFHSKNTEAAAVRDVNDMRPWHMYAIKKDKRFRMMIEDRNEFPITMILSNALDADTLAEADLDIDTMEMHLIMTGSSLPEWLETENTVTGLCPFMSMAKKSNCHSLCDIYDVAMLNLNRIQYFATATDLMHTKDEKCCHQQNVT
jgi:hypothetical protein